MAAAQRLSEHERAGAPAGHWPLLRPCTGTGSPHPTPSVACFCLLQEKEGIAAKAMAAARQGGGGRGGGRGQFQDPYERLFPGRQVRQSFVCCD